MNKHWMGIATILGTFVVSAGCAADGTIGDGDDGEGEGEGGADSGGDEEIGYSQSALQIGIDPNLQPDVPALVYGPNDPGRPVVAVMDMSGARADMVEGELIFTADDDVAIKAYISKLNGVITQVAAPSKVFPEQPAAGAQPYRKQYLVKIDTNKVDTNKLEGLLRTKLKSPSYTLSFGVTTKAGLATITAAVDAAVNADLDAGVNWVGRGATIPSGSTAEAPLSASWTPPGGYSTDAFQWPHLNGGRGPLAAGGVNTGVAQAWRMMALAGRVGTTTTVGILDQGFAPNADFGVFTATSNIPFRDALDMPNTQGCGPGNPCLWHGTGAMQTAVGTPDNGFGAAGSAGPFGRAALVSTWYDFFTTMFAMNSAVGAGARVLSMSFGAQIPWPLAWSGLPFHWHSQALRGRGVLQFAAAGNSAIDVDQSCGIVGECDWILPCEAGGVLCVGATNWDGPPTRAGYSSFGTAPLGPETVRLWAPGTTFVGPDPQSPASNMAQAYSGTSAATPFAAGVAAMVWAARPTMTADAVESHLLSTAVQSASDSTVRRSIKAYDAVLRALGIGRTTANSCAHPVCSTGTKLTAGCDMPLSLPPGMAIPPGAANCVQNICAVDPFCCNNSWDSICRDEVTTVCGVACD
jgi:serine protease